MHQQHRVLQISRSSQTNLLFLPNSVKFTKNSKITEFLVSCTCQRKALQTAYHLLLPQLIILFLFCIVCCCRLMLPCCVMWKNACVHITTLLNYYFSLSFLFCFLSVTPSFFTSYFLFVTHPFFRAFLLGLSFVPFVSFCISASFFSFLSFRFFLYLFSLLSSLLNSSFRLSFFSSLSFFPSLFRHCQCQLYQSVSSQPCHPSSSLPFIPPLIPKIHNERTKERVLSVSVTGRPANRPFLIIDSHHSLTH